MLARHPAGVHLAAPALAGLCALALAACGNTVRQQPISHSLFEDMIVTPYPVYWLGASFHGLAVTEVIHDTSGALWVQYGDCLQGGQGTCIAPLRIVSSPDNSFVPGGSTPARPQLIRGAPAILTEGGAAIAIPTGPVVVDIFADSPALAAAAARTMVPINQPGAPEASLPPRLPDSGYNTTPLPAQLPNPLHPLTVGG